MVQKVVDESLRGLLNGGREEIALVDEAGQSVGHFVPEGEYRKLLYAWVESTCPYTPEQREQFAKETGGRALAEIWKSLEER